MCAQEGGARAPTLPSSPAIIIVTIIILIIIPEAPLSQWRSGGGVVEAGVWPGPVLNPEREDPQGVPLGHRSRFSSHIKAKVS